MTRTNNRSDIAIAVTNDGEMLIAQGNPAISKLSERDDLADYEAGLFFSQLRHRVAWRTVNQENNQIEYHVGTPTTAKRALSSERRCPNYRCQLEVGVHRVAWVD